MKDKLFCEMSYREKLKEYHQNFLFGKLLSKILKRIPYFKEDLKKQELKK
jgi:hypothetical protein